MVAMGREQQSHTGQSKTPLCAGLCSGEHHGSPPGSGWVTCVSYILGSLVPPAEVAGNGSYGDLAYRRPVQTTAITGRESEYLGMGIMPFPLNGFDCDNSLWYDTTVLCMPVIMKTAEDSGGFTESVLAWITW